MFSRIYFFYRIRLGSPVYWSRNVQLVLNKLHTRGNTQELGERLQAAAASVAAARCCLTLRIGKVNVGAPDVDCAAGRRAKIEMESPGTAGNW